MPTIPAAPTESMKCPYCAVSFASVFQENLLASHVDSMWKIRWVKCPACSKLILFLRRAAVESGGNRSNVDELIWPKVALRQLPSEVLADYASEFQEAWLVLPYSSKASAALSRRLLQRLLREKGGVKPTELANEIDQVFQSRSLPTYLAEALDAVRHIGNFATHPIKSISTGEIIEVEVGETEWLLDTLEGLFDFYFVQESRLKQKRDALNEKLRRAGKPQLR